jgi:hypothetical protein
VVGGDFFFLSHENVPDSDAETRDLKVPGVLLCFINLNTDAVGINRVPVVSPGVTAPNLHFCFRRYYAGPSRENGDPVSLRKLAIFRSETTKCPNVSVNSTRAQSYAVYYEVMTANIQVTSEKSIDKRQDWRAYRDIGVK